MSRAIRVALGTLLLTPVVCLAVVTTNRGCPRAPGCATAGPVMLVMGVGTRVLEAAVIALLLVSVVRIASALRATTSACARLAVVSAPAALRAAQRRTGVARVHCLADAPLPAFCHGGLRPVIAITAATVDSLPASALDAVLLHEETHRRRRDPLRRAVRRGLADVVPWSRLVASCDARATVREELRADDRATRLLGRPAVARALLAMAPAATKASTVAGFGDAAVPRVEQLLGNTPQLPVIPVECAVRAGAAAAALLALLLCALPGPL
jgi:Zn-dependent protease with chaperone function